MILFVNYISKKKKKKKKKELDSRNFPENIQKLGAAF